MEGISGDGWEEELARWLSAVPRAAAAPGAAALGAGLPRGPDPAGRAEERRADGRPRGAGRPPAAAPLRLHLALGHRTPRGRAAQAADRLVGGPDAVLVVDDTALVKQGRRSVGVKRQYCGQLGKRANCQSLVSLTLARAEVPVGVGLRLSLPEDWCADAARRAAAGVPETVAYRPKWRSRSTRSTACWPPAPASAPCWPTPSTAGRPSSGPASRSGSSAYAVGILPTQQVYPAGRDARLPEAPASGRPARAPGPLRPERGRGRVDRGRPAAFRAVPWRTGTKGPLKAEFAALRCAWPTGRPPRAAAPPR